MAIEITARHLRISEGQQQFARDKAEQLIAEFPKIEHVHVILDIQRHQFSAEFVVQHKGLAKVEAREDCDDLVAGIDLAYEKVEKQLRKHRDKVVDSHHQRA
ncbi:MAG: ribosome-associated translation inhibitor RaiA [bacterium]|jgi:putative sigma-54 modulation protein